MVVVVDAKSNFDSIVDPVTGYEYLNFTRAIIAFVGTKPKQIEKAKSLYAVRKYFIIIFDNRLMFFSSLSEWFIFIQPNIELAFV
jgi:hypothetical protein